MQVLTNGKYNIQPEIDGCNEVGNLASIKKFDTSPIKFNYIF